MPDLQVFSKNLNRYFKGKKLEAINVARPKSLRDKPAALKKALVGAKLTSVYRSGKELRFQFSNGTIMGLHLMLHGELKLFDKDDELRHAIITFHFKGAPGLAITDWQGKANVKLNPEDKEGVDALAPELNITYLREIANSRSPIKTVMMDQDRIRGIGNAYADEILWKAGISPFSKANKIPPARLRKLLSAIKSVLRGAEKKIIKKEPDLISGEVRDFLVIHNAKAKQSPTGGEILTRTVGGRKTYFTKEQELFE